jgi:hypothetical protein
MTKKKQREFHQEFIDSWTRQLELFDLAFGSTFGYNAKVSKTLRNRRSRILWNITRATNLKKAV